MYSSLPLHVCHVQKLRATLNRIHILFHFVAILSLIYYRISHLFSGTGNIPVVAWTLITISELLISFVWFFTQSFRWRPVLRTPFPERIPGDEVLPAIDVFICTVDPKKEPTVEVMNTVLSAMSLDYPPEKLAVYLSDDGGSAITLYAIKEAAFFARSWLPFCRKYEIKNRCPQAYFSSFGDEDRREKSDYFETEEVEIKTKYEKFKESVEKAGESVGDTYVFNEPLVKDGRRVYVIERDLTKTDRMVGELLQPGGYLKLIELGLEDCVEGIDAQKIFGYALLKDGKSTRVSYPLENFSSNISGRSIHNGRFIQRMQEKASSLSKHSFRPPHSYFILYAYIFEFLYSACGSRITKTTLDILHNNENYSQDNPLNISKIQSITSNN